MQRQTRRLDARRPIHRRNICCCGTQSKRC